MCFNWNPTQAGGIEWLCPTNQIYEAKGASWQTGHTASDRPDNPYDQAILFFAKSRSGPFFQYNYMENFDTTSSFNTWLTRGFSWEGTNSSTDPILNRCGCIVCPATTCNLAMSGPTIGGITSDPDAPVPNTAYNPQLEACGGSSGACMSVNGDACCVGTQTYERIPADNANTCSSLCSNYWSAISSAKPLSQLWSTIQYKLPAW